MSLRLRHACSAASLTRPQIRQRLAAEFGLTTEKKPKPIMRAEDEFEMLRTLWGSSTLTFDHERQRVQLALIMQLAGITGTRPSALLALRFKDIGVTLLRDTEGRGRDKILLEFTFRHPKTYRAPKQPNTFPIPEVCNDSRLPLCPQIALLPLMFADEAFAPSSLTGPDQLFSLEVPTDLRQLKLPIKQTLGDKPIFRTVVKTANGYEVSPTDAATYDWLNQQLKRLGAETGFELPVGAYAFRRGSGEALDDSGRSPHVVLVVRGTALIPYSVHTSEGLRNLILQHADTSVFLKNYLSHYVTGDVAAAFRGLEPQTAVVKTASGMTRSIERRQPNSLTQQQLLNFERRLELRLLVRTKKSLDVRSNPSEVHIHHTCQGNDSLPAVLRHRGTGMPATKDPSQAGVGAGESSLSSGAGAGRHRTATELDSYPSSVTSKADHA
ncbi:hypothetical protein LTR87_017765 [Friedmanniomyces endolithicus]|nr:hypothetical protein LTR87_017765 [Friedmanniomyces endolithicus]